MTSTTMYFLPTAPVALSDLEAGDPHLFPVGLDPRGTTRGLTPGTVTVGGRQGAGKTAVLRAQAYQRLLRGHDVIVADLHVDQHMYSDLEEHLLALAMGTVEAVTALEAVLDEGDTRMRPLSVIVDDFEYSQATSDRFHRSPAGRLQALLPLAAAMPGVQLLLGAERPTKRVVIGDAHIELFGHGLPRVNHLPDAVARRVSKAYRRTLNFPQGAAAIVQGGITSVVRAPDAHQHLASDLEAAGVPEVPAGRRLDLTPRDALFA